MTKIKTRWQIETTLTQVNKKMKLNLLESSVIHRFDNRDSIICINSKNLVILDYLTRNTLTYNMCKEIKKEIESEIINNLRYYPPLDADLFRTEKS